MTVQETESRAGAHSSPSPVFFARIVSGLTLPALALVLSDQLLKAWCSSHIQILKRFPIFGQDFLVLSRVLNRGMAWDRFSNIPTGYIEPYTRYFPTAVLAVLVIFAAFRIRAASLIERLSFTLLIAGGASNLWDHWHSQYVVDTLQFYIGDRQYIPFNIADAGIVAGTALLVYHLSRELMESFKAPAPVASEHPR